MKIRYDFEDIQEGNKKVYFIIGHVGSKLAYNTVLFLARAICVSVEIVMYALLFAINPSIAESLCYFFAGVEISKAINVIKNNKFDPEKGNGFIINTVCLINEAVKELGLVLSLPFLGFLKLVINSIEKITYKRMVERPENEKYITEEMSNMKEEKIISELSRITEKCEKLNDLEKAVAFHSLKNSIIIYQNNKNVGSMLSRLSKIEDDINKTLSGITESTEEKEYEKEKTLTLRK